jgi:hypothetical protein
MLVIAKPGARCPKEGKPKEYITDLEAAEVPESTYYKRLVDDGSLLITGKKRGGKR